MQVKLKNPLLISIEQAAELIRISPHTVRKYEREGRIKAVRVGKRVLIPIAEINRIATEGLHSTLTT